MKRIILIVMDSVGVGELPDAEKYGDLGASTLGNIVKATPDIKLPNLSKMGLFHIDNDFPELLKMKIQEKTLGAFGKLGEASSGKDTITGHWEIAGLLTKTPFKTYPNGFPKRFMDMYEKAIGKETLGNYAASGTVIIEDLGPEHEKTGKPIVYTSADSVFQIAANIDIIPLDKLYEICEVARKMLVGEYACGRVIARPYELKDGKRKRTSDRKDYAVSPGGKTVLDLVEESGKQVFAIGKINDIFNGHGITKSIHTESNMDGVDKTIEVMKEDFEGLIFTNLVDFDSLYGHRRDPKGYAKCLEEFDERLPEILDSLKEGDVLIFCADHGNDPTHSGWDHTREYVPVLVYGYEIKENVNLGTRRAFADIGATIAEILSVEKTEIGESFLNLLK